MSSFPIRMSFSAEQYMGYRFYNCNTLSSSLLKDVLFLAYSLPPVSSYPTTLAVYTFPQNVTSAQDGNLHSTSPHRMAQYVLMIMCSVGNMTEQLQNTCNSPLPFHEVLLGLSITVVGISGLKDGPGIKA